MSVGCCTRCWTTAPSTARRGPKVRGQCKVWVALPRAGTAHTHAHVRAQGLCTDPRGDQRLRAPLGCIPGVITLRRRPMRGAAGTPPMRGAAGTPETQRGSCVPACLERPRRQRSFPVLRLPFWPQKMWRASPPGWHSAGPGAAENQGAFPGSVWRISCPQCPVILPRACACSYCAVENPTFRFWTFEDGGERTEVSRACHPRQGPSRAVAQGESCDH